jgi:hypothetical protein
MPAHLPTCPQAHLAPATSQLHADALMELLLQSSKIRGATHNMLAYRIEQPDKGTFLQASSEACWLYWLSCLHAS